MVAPPGHIRLDFILDDIDAFWGWFSLPRMASLLPSVRMGTFSSTLQNQEQFWVKAEVLDPLLSPGRCVRRRSRPGHLVSPTPTVSPTPKVSTGCIFATGCEYARPAWSLERGWEMPPPPVFLPSGRSCMPPVSSLVFDTATMRIHVPYSFPCRLQGCGVRPSTIQTDVMQRGATMRGTRDRGGLRVRRLAAYWLLCIPCSRLRTRLCPAPRDDYQRGLVLSFPSAKADSCTIPMRAVKSPP
ncbi:hypothetical protein B0H12DRAFT_447536 [Mycena haematopus]|nr:hypothetical protein B0H12DRAFT_447536 [Mycena haematopus]